MFFLACGSVCYIGSQGISVEPKEETANVSLSLPSKQSPKQSLRHEVTGLEKYL